MQHFYDVIGTFTTIQYHNWLVMSNILSYIRCNYTKDEPPQTAVCGGSVRYFTVLIACSAKVLLTTLS